MFILNNLSKHLIQTDISSNYFKISYLYLPLIPILPKNEKPCRLKHDFQVFY